MEEGEQVCRYIAGDGSRKQEVVRISINGCYSLDSQDGW